jgi:hypothetical protein
VRGVEPDLLSPALAAGEIGVGTSIRRTLHAVAADDHASLAAVADAAGVNDWWRSTQQPPGVDAVRADLLAFAHETRTADQLVAFLEDWVRANPDTLGEAELTLQRQYNWRPLYTWTALARVPADGVWSSRGPTAYRAAIKTAPANKTDTDTDAALAAVIRCHLRAFGPAGADDIATWIGWKTTPVRAALAGLRGSLEVVETDGGRTLYDLPDAPRPDPATPAPVRLLPSFDSTQLAYTHKHRQRIVADEHKGAVYARANLRIRPTVLVDGFVAGTWTVSTTRRAVTVAVTPFGPWDAAIRAAVVAEGERLMWTVHSGLDARVTVET